MLRKLLSDLNLGKAIDLNVKLNLEIFLFQAMPTASEAGLAVYIAQLNKHNKTQKQTP